MNNNFKILLADDNTEFSKNCKLILQKRGLEVFMCEKDGKVLLENIKQIQPDAVLADVILPNIDIIGVMQATKAINDNILFFAMTGSDNPRLENETLNAGAAYYFIKPFDINLLADRIVQMTVECTNLKHGRKLY